MPSEAELRKRHPEVYAGGNIDRRTCSRVVPMEVLSLGMCRTGCATMQAALTILGYPCYHYFQIYANLPDVNMWDEALDAKFFGKGSPYTRADFDQLLGHVGAITDVPAICFAPELRTAYPAAKVVLVERDEDRWFKSFNDTMVAALEERRNRWIKLIDPAGVVDRVTGNFARIVRGPWRSDPARPDSLRQNARSVYREHNAMVKRITPPDQLLEFRLEDGWEPLCRFLGRPVPDTPFPHCNETAVLKEKIELVLMRGIKRGLARLAMPVAAMALAAAAAAWWMWA